MLEKHMVKPHAITATALAPRTIENGVMRGAGRAALERTPSFSELIAPVFRIKSLLDVQKNILRNGFIFVIILIRFFLKSLRLFTRSSAWRAKDERHITLGGFFFY